MEGEKVKMRKLGGWLSYCPSPLAPAALSSRFLQCTPLGPRRLLTAPFLPAQRAFSGRFPGVGLWAGMCLRRFTSTKPHRSRNAAFETPLHALYVTRLPRASLAVSCAACNHCIN